MRKNRKEFKVEGSVPIRNLGPVLEQKVSFILSSNGREYNGIIEILRGMQLLCF